MTLGWARGRPRMNHMHLDEISRLMSTEALRGNRASACAYAVLVRHCLTLPSSLWCCAGSTGAAHSACN